MDKTDAKKRIEALKNLINEHNRRYYVENAPSISDYDFDLLMQELIQLETLHPEYITEDSPTRKVGSDLEGETASGFRQYPHRHPMLSLANTYNIEELSEFDERIRRLTTQPFTYNCELKLDGTGINLLYKNGLLVRALTRGDGTVGDDVTRNVKTIKSIPHTLHGDYPAEFEIRGEIFMPFDSFDRLNYEKEENQEQKFANPRNAAAGSLKMLDSSIVAQRGLQCTLYHLIVEGNFDISTHSQALQKAASWGLPISEYSKVCSNISEVIEYINTWDIKRKELLFPTDGIVVKVNQFAVQGSLGFTSKTPRWAVAYKFKPENALTQLFSVDYQVGRTGAVTPVANLSPVQLSGTMVKRATLHNADFMAQLDLHEGDWVYVEKGGEIIPKITGVELSKRNPAAPVFEFPANCPVCGTELVRDADQAKFFCPNSDGCAPQIEGSFLHFCSRKAMDVNLGEVAIHQLYTRGYIYKLEDLYNLSDMQLLSLDKWKEKSVSNFKESLKKSLGVPFEKVLYALGIKYIGETTAKTLALRFGSIEALRKATREELLETEDVGEALADSLIDYFAQPEHLETIAALKAAGLQFETVQKAPVSEELKGMTIMITGNYSIPRETMKAYIEAHGGKVGSSVTSSTTYLLAGAKAGEAKLEKAARLGIPVISEEEFYKIANPAGATFTPAGNDNEPKLFQDSV